MDNLKKTALYDAHIKCGGKIVDFAGWALPLYYEGIIEEHEAVRNAAGLFDVSHMGEIEIRGTQAFDFVQNLITNDISVLEDNQVLYSLMCCEDGGIVDDLLVYKFSKEDYYLVVNASNIQKDYQWMLANKRSFSVDISDISQEISQLAIQGPKAGEILQKLTDLNLADIRFFFCRRQVAIDGVNCLISRTGYTGEDGFEIYVSNNDVEKLWTSILRAGEDMGIKPAGLGCRDTLRFEACLPLYGNELSENITPLEAGLEYFVKLSKYSFIGKSALEKQKKEGLIRKLVGFEMVERGIPRHGYSVTCKGNHIGVVTTGYFSPTLKKNIGLAIIDFQHTKLDSEIEIIVRNKPVKARVINRHFYSKNYKK